MRDFLKRRERERKLEKLRGKTRKGNGNGSGNGNGGRGRAQGAFDFDAPRSPAPPATPSHYKATDAELLLVQRSVRAMFLGPEGRVYPSTAAELAAAKTLHAAGFIALLGPIKPGASWESAKGKLATKPSKLTAVLPTNPGQELIATPHANRRLSRLETKQLRAALADDGVRAIYKTRAKAAGLTDSEIRKLITRGQKAPRGDAESVLLDVIHELESSGESKAEALSKYGMAGRRRPKATLPPKPPQKATAQRPTASNPMMFQIGGRGDEGPARAINRPGRAEARRVMVSSLEEASRLYGRLRDESGEGFSTWAEGHVGKYRISYNGKVWLGDQLVIHPQAYAEEVAEQPSGRDAKKAAGKKPPRKKCPPKSRKKTRGVYDTMVTDPEHMPSKVAAAFAKGLKKAIGRGSLVCTDDARSTATPGWDYGFVGAFDITLPSGDELRAMLVLHKAAHPPEVSGNVQLDAEYGGLIALARGLTWDGVVKSLIEQTGSHLKAGASK